MLPGRRRDFLAGRGAARRALAAAGLPAGEILREGRRPVLPAGSVGSISHSAGLAVALAAPAHRFRALGCDLELRGLPTAAAHVVLTPDEQTWAIGAPTPAEAEHRLLAAFSAKEAAFKAFGTLLPGSVTNLLGIAAHPVPGGFRARPRALPDRVLEVRVHPVGPGVFSWTAAPAE
ncbi:hypothetical protein GCM10009544_09910 [Streptomyces stramineus]|uniref:Uncharacterized protein n=2 Tax=Streptomyces TaxID=1883 RepID=A0ABN0ZIW8_9ACTN